MTQITQEAIEAACAGYIGDSWINLLPATQDHVRARIRLALEAALPFLPIAVEGKVKALEWDDEGGEYIAQSVIGWFHIGRPASYWNLTTPHGVVSSHETRDEAKAAAQSDYETRILSALISSPGKDGGQEVEAAEWQGRYWIEEENRWSNWITNPVGYPWAHEPQEGKSEIRYLYPQPASTALVDTTHDLISDWLQEGVEDLPDDTPVNVNIGGRLIIHNKLGELRSALSASQSTSREGER